MYIYDMHIYIIYAFKSFQNVLVEIDAMVVLAASLPAAARVLAVLPDASTASRDLPPQVAVLLEACRHGEGELKRVGRPSV